MKRFACVLWMASLLVPTGCSKKTAAGEDCDAGQVPVNGECRQLCLSNRDCGTGEMCGDSGYCVASAGPAPTILAINGDGYTDGRPDYGSNRIHAGLVINGVNLNGVTVSLDGSGAGLPSVASLFVRPGARDDRIEVDLPVDVRVGAYVLEVSNDFGADQAGVQVLQGEQGVDGVCDAAACVSQTLPGASRITSVFARATGAGATEPQSLLVDGTQEISTPADGIWLGVLNRDTHGASNNPDHNRNYDLTNIAERASLVLELAQLDAADIAILVSRGDISAHVNVDVGSGQTLRDELIRLGASPAIRQIPTDQPMVLIGYPGIGQSNAVVVLSNSGHAEVAAIIADDFILGPRLNDALYRSPSDNVGIGTNSPEAKLHIEGNAALHGGAPQIKFTDTTADESDYWIHINTNRFYILWDEDGDGAWDAPHPMYFQGRDAFIGGNLTVAGSINVSLTCTTVRSGPDALGTSVTWVNCPAGYIATGSGWEPGANWDSSTAHWIEAGADNARCGFYIGNLQVNWNRDCTCCRVQ